ncbi:MAG TPA: lipopolysaccharide assembly protein LapB [Methylibium sp.]|uniref:lipopolysaccharide assembly protein LapB n=1 Tax=Methylibium sp. TaxID=2067992 RepID=UPI002DBD1F8F|nr:lipopolysaccharide assembly protein LapB [Methylibium sp.]HEU4457645.1 lipopolysaccharide assembly protein LapB [Methylibium sp.]
MDFDPFDSLTLALVGLMLAFALGWLASRFDLRQWKREQQESPKAYFKGLNLLLNEQQDKAIDAFIEAVQHDPGSSDLHFALGNLFRRRGEYERAVRVHQHLLGRGDLSATERERAQHALAQDYLKAGLFDRAEEAFRRLEGTAFATDARLERLLLHEHARDWHAAIEVARKLEAAGAGSFAQRIAHHHCELALEADARLRPDDADAELRKAREAAPQAARPRVIEAQRLAQAGRHRDALAAWGDLFKVQPPALALVAGEIAASAKAAGSELDLAAGRKLLQAAYERQPCLDLLQALRTLEPAASDGFAALASHLERHPTPSAAAALLQHRDALGSTPTAAETRRLQQVLAAAARPLRRYRCAACGFEAQNYFWQCPGCHSWDSYPPTRLEDQ